MPNCFVTVSWADTAAYNRLGFLCSSEPAHLKQAVCRGWRTACFFLFSELDMAMQSNFTKMHRVGKGNPINWPSVVHSRYLLKAGSYDTAYVMGEYPCSGFAKCLMRVWHEQSTQGAQKYNWRLCYQTTVRQWNITYTDALRKLDRTDSKAKREFDVRFNEEYERIRMVVKGNFWNNPSYDRYKFFACWELMDCRPRSNADDCHSQLCVRPFELYVNSSYLDMVAFLDKVVAYREELSPAQIVSLHRMARYGSQFNKEHWPQSVAWEAWGLPPAK